MKFRSLFLPLLLGLVACAPSAPGPRLGEIYNRAAQTHEDLRNPVILIPGLMGSRLVNDADGTIVWGSFAGGYEDPGGAEGARQFALPMIEGVPLSSLRDSVVTRGSLDRMKIRILGLPVSVDAYSDILGVLGVGGYRSKDLADRGEVDYGDDHYTCFQFSYDWRRDNAENARLLDEFIVHQREFVQSEIERRYGIKDYDVHFDIVAHSMGALVARYFLRYGGEPIAEPGPVPDPSWAGARFVDRAILVAPPNGGAPQTLVEMVHGKDFGFLLPEYSAALLGTMPSLYELLPRPRQGRIVDEQGVAIDSIYDPSYWEQMGWGLVDPDEDSMLEKILPGIDDPEHRHRIALDHLGKCLRNAERFAEALDRPSMPPANLQIDLIAGDALDTPSVVQVKGNTVEVVAKAPGDGTVLRSSALMDERTGTNWRPGLISPIAWNQVIFLFSNHWRLTRDAAFVDNMLYMLMEAPR